MELTQEHSILQTNIRRFVVKEVEPRAAKIDQENHFPEEMISKIADLGLFGVLIPEQYGGFGFDTRSLVITLEEIARSSGSLALVLAAHNALAAATILAGTSEEMKRKYLPLLGAGSKIGGACNQDYVNVKIDGDALWGAERVAFNGARADVIIFKAVCGDGLVRRVANTPKGVLRLEPRDDLLGMRGAGIAAAVFDGVALNKTEDVAPSDEMANVEGLFWLALASIAVGINQGALEAAIKYSKERKQFGQAICCYDMVQDMLAEMATRTHAARLMVFDGADRRDAGKPFVKEALMSKAFATQSASYNTRLGVQIHGGYGYIKDYAIERMFRDAKVTEVLGGTTETHRLNLAKSLL